MIDDELRFNIVNYRLFSARNSLGEVLSLSRDQYFNAAISRMYYACFHAASALLINAGIEARTHTELYPQAVAFIDAIEKIIKG